MSEADNLPTVELTDEAKKTEEETKGAGEGEEEKPEEKFVASLEPGTRARVRALQGFQKEFDKTFEEFKAEERALLMKYEALYEPIHNKRRDVICGSRQPTAEEIAAGVPESAKDQENVPPTDEDGIPEFWLKALQNNDATQELVQERDEDCLKFLKDITCETFKDSDKNGFTLSFHFKENPYFEEPLTLTKKYHLLEEAYEDIMDRAEGCDINWKEGKNLTVVMKKKRQKSKKAPNQVRTQIREEPCDSFFNFFKPPSPDDVNDDDDLDQMEEMIEADFEVGQVIKERLIKQAVDWYTGAAVGPEIEEDEDEEDDDEDDEDEEEEEMPRKRKGKGKKQQMDAAQLQQAAEQCKQQ